jgi:hypothetical protein
MSTTFTPNLGLGIPGVGDAGASYASVISTDLTQLDSSCLGAFGVASIGGLNVSINGGTMIASTGAKVAVASVPSQAMTANQTNYVYVSDAGAFTVSTSGFPASGTFHVPLATVVCGGSAVSSIADARLPYSSCGANRNAIYLALAGGSMTGPVTCTGTGNNAGVILASVSTPGAPTEGQLWNDSTQKAVGAFVAGETGYLSRSLYNQTNDVNFSGTGTATTFVGTGSGSNVLAAGFLTIGKKIVVKASGIFPTTKASGPGTWQFALTIGSVALATFGAPPTLGNSLTNAPWFFEAEITVRAIGSGTSTNVRVQAKTSLPMTNADNQTLNTQGIGNGAVSSGFDSTVTNAIVLKGQFGTSDATNSATCTNLSIETPLG